MEYNRLVMKYKNLSEDEKNAILIYKSRLSYCINEITSIPNFHSMTNSEILKNIKDYDNFTRVYNEMKLILDNPLNMLFKYGIFKNIDFTSELNFISSILYVYKILNNINIVTSSNMTLYRIVSSSNPKFLSKGELVSTSLDIDNCEKFIIDNTDITLYSINLEPNSRVIVVPYSIKIDYLTNKLYIENEDNQKEVIFFKNDNDYNINSSKTKKYQNNKIEIVKMNAFSKKHKLTR